MIDRKRSRELRAALDAEEISMGELAEIDSAFREIPRRELRDLPENATAGDQLDEIDDARARAALTRLRAAAQMEAREIAAHTLRLVAYLAAQTEWDSDTLGVLGEHVAAVTKAAGLPPAVDNGNDDAAQAYWLDVCDALGIDYPEDEEA